MVLFNKINMLSSFVCLLRKLTYYRIELPKIGNVSAYISTHNTYYTLSILRCQTNFLLIHFPLDKHGILWQF